jgi:hypothetical protein
MKLHAIRCELELLYGQIAEQGGEITPGQEMQLEILEDSKAAKLHSSAKYVHGLEEECEEIRAELERVELEAKRLRSRLKQRESRLEGFLAYVGRQLGEQRNWENALFSFKWHEGQPVLGADNVDVRKAKWPERFIRVKEEYNPNKIELKKAIKAGELVPEGITLGSVWRLRLDKGRGDGTEKCEGQRRPSGAES